MTSLKVVAGFPGGPLLGTNYFTSEIIRNAIVHLIIIDNVPQNDLEPSPDYVFDSTTGTITIQIGTWVTNNKLIILYTKSNCC